MKNRTIAMITLALIVAMALPVFAGESSTKFSGTYFFDYFNDFTDRADSDQTPERGFELRRAYVTVKKSWGDVMFRSTTDIDPKLGTGNLNVYSKYVYLQHSGLIKNAKVLVGQHSPSTHGWIEKRWGYRSIVKTISDINKWTQSATFGVGLAGKAGDGMFDYYLDFNNGNGYKEPVRKGGQGFVGRGAYHGNAGVVLSALYTSNTEGTYLDDNDAVDGSGEANTYIEGLAGIERDGYRIFGQYGMFTNGDSEIKETGLSIFGRATLTEGTYGIARVDLVDPDTDTDDDGYTWFLVGLDYELHEGYYIQPSFHTKSSQADGVDSESEFVLTLFGKI